MFKFLALPVIFTLLTTSTPACMKEYLGGDTNTQDQTQDTTKTPDNKTPDQVQTTKPTDNSVDNGSVNTPAFTEQDAARGYYYGTKEQKKSGTPADWIFVEGGRNSMWKSPSK